MASSIRDTGVYYLTPTELATKISQDPSFYETGAKVGARVVPGSIVRSPDGKGLTFRVTDGARSYPVSYRGLVPDMFTDSVDVVLEGRLARNGTFQATTVLTKCASRYENAPQKYQNTPGYRQTPAPTTASRT
jgi:cytochrome c-type biogenesis protein CcmE